MDVSHRRGRRRAVMAWVAGGAAALALVLPKSPTRADQTTPPAGVSGWRADFSRESRLVVTPEGIDRVLFPRQSLSWEPRVDRFRGGADLYAKVAPAVVVVRTSNAHGTGFLISPDGWNLTNNHVVVSGPLHEAARQASYVSIHLGRLGADGVMALTPAPVRAYVYKLDPVRDLGLLKLDSTPTPLPFLPLSPTPPRPGMPATMIGHPASGMLWTYRTGQVSAAGRAPADLVDLVMARLSAASSQRGELTEAIRQLPSRRILLSSCEANPGDSGGPLVDDSGQVLGVTFAVPGDVGRAKFTYHVHVDEVEAFVQARPSRPTLVVPDPWDAGPKAHLRDFDGDGRIDTLILGDDEPEVVLIDLSGRTSFAGIRSDDDAYTKLVAGRGWRFDVALQVKGREATAHYDTDGDGVVDLVRIGDDNEHASVQMTRGPQGRWSVASATGPVLAYDLVRGPRLQKQLRIILAVVSRTR